MRRGSTPGRVRDNAVVGDVRHLYVHVPFCAHRCGYCDFVTVTGREHQHAPYVDALLAELELRGGVLADDVATVYLGGGTPSLLGPELLARLLDALPPAGVERTVEVNPETVDVALATVLAERGCRVSLGAQSLDAGLLAVLERRTRPEGVRARRGDPARGGRARPLARPHLRRPRREPRRARRRSRRPARPRARPPVLLRARGQARHALHLPPRARASGPGGAARGPPGARRGAAREPRATPGTRRRASRGRATRDGTTAPTGWRGTTSAWASARSARSTACAGATHPAWRPTSRPRASGATRRTPRSRWTPARAPWSA